MKRKKTSEKQKFVDDGRTIYDMSGIDDMHRTGPRQPRRENVSVSKKERRMLIRAALATYLPIVLGVLACFTVAALIMYFWFK